MNEDKKSQISAQYSAFEFKPVSWVHSNFLKLFLAFFSLSLLPVILSSLLLIAAFETAIREYANEEQITVLSDNAKVQIFLVLLMVVILVTFTALLLARNISQPVQLLTKAVKRISSGDLSIEIKTDRKDEVGLLVRFFNGMVQRLREIQDRNVAISRLKSQFVSIAAHQLRTPLSGLKWSMSLLLGGDFGPLSAQQEKLLQQSYETNQRLIRLINDLLNVARIEEGRFGYSFGEVVIVDLLDEIVSEASSQAEQRGTKIDVKKLVDKNFKIIADSERIVLAISNLLDNAIKYTKPGGIIELSVVQEGDFVKISIKDNGIGIPLGEQRKIFSRFGRASNVGTSHTDGTGLGLFIAKNIILRHGGKIWFQSQEGKGTIFYCTLPIREDLIPEKTPSFEEFIEAL